MTLNLTARYWSYSDNQAFTLQDDGALSQNTPTS
jgi:hypothetical protein